MFAAASRFIPLTAKFCRQVVPPVIATLIAAGLISAYNRTFSSPLTQPRLGALGHRAGDGLATGATLHDQRPRRTVAGRGDGKCRR